MICLVVWKTLQIDALVQVQYPHEQHALAVKTPNQAKTHVKEYFFNSVDINSQPNRRHDDSTSATHYFLPKFKTIQTLKKRRFIIIKSVLRHQ